ncbi:M35 family metallo-endopeptidase [Uliginosibacterium gangwonense]|uniref:M35 family metallo-endopeptidase n=1 Tax=Uliginosibacterium gangwonense TaxID=392736 RepID=UPI0012FB51CB|nr:M35 family metallo-endopeptidase [Uliginosibacterium gangwonense]
MRSIFRLGVKSSQSCVIALLIAGAGFAQAATPNTSLNASVAFTFDKQKSTAPLAKFTLTNVSTHSVWVLKRELPNSQYLTNNQFRVTRDGQELSYHGIMVKYVAPTASDYVEIKAGSAYTANIDIAKFYDMERGGDFSINFRANQLSVLDSAPASQGVVRARTRTGINLDDSKHLSFTGAPGTLQFKTTATAQSAIAASAVVKASGMTLQFTSCSTSRQATLKTAITNATTYNNKAVAWIKANPKGGTLYNTWFGAYTATRFATVKAHFDGIAKEFASQTIRLECDDTSEYSSNMAYVQQNDPYHIYIGRGYWGAAATGYDSKAGTLIHESSHFFINGGTEDYVYGLQEGKDLAISSPDNAVQNADNVEHFAESL